MIWLSAGRFTHERGHGRLLQVEGVQQRRGECFASDNHKKAGIGRNRSRQVTYLETVDERLNQCTVSAAVVADVEYKTLNDLRVHNFQKFVREIRKTQKRSVVT
jgi:hypothetical protein